MDFHHVVVVQIDHLLGVADDGGNVTGQEEFVLTDTENQGATATCANQSIGLILADDGQAESSFDEGEGLENRFLQVALVELCNQVSHHFGVCFGLEQDAVCLETLLQGGIVFDNAVMDNGNLAVKALVGVGVLFGGGAVGGPACVGDTDASAYRGGLELSFQCRNFARCANSADFIIVDEGDARTVVTTVF